MYVCVPEAVVRAVAGVRVVAGVRAVFLWDSPLPPPRERGAGAGTGAGAGPPGNTPKPLNKVEAIWRAISPASGAISTMVVVEGDTKK